MKTTPVNLPVAGPPQLPEADRRTGASQDRKQAQDDRQASGAMLRYAPGARAARTSLLARYRVAARGQGNTASRRSLRDRFPALAAEEDMLATAAALSPCPRARELAALALDDKPIGPDGHTAADEFMLFGELQRPGFGSGPGLQSELTEARRVLMHTFGADSVEAMESALATAATRANSPRHASAVRAIELGVVSDASARMIAEERRLFGDALFPGF